MGGRRGREVEGEVVVVVVVVAAVVEAVVAVVVAAAVVIVWVIGCGGSAKDRRDHPFLVFYIYKVKKAIN